MCQKDGLFREPHVERRFSRRFQKSNLFKNRIFVKFDFWERRENRHFTYISLARSQTYGRSTVYSVYIVEIFIGVAFTTLTIT
jgi:hypothetical protein